MNDTFSSLVLAVKLERSKKLRVDIAMEEKNGCEGSVAGVGRLFECRVISDRSKAIKKLWRALQSRADISQDVD
jgi:hypothetical protein